MKDIPYDDVGEIYKNRYWDRIKGDQIAGKSLGLALCASDFVVNAGVRRSAKTCRRLVGVTPKEKVDQPRPSPWH